MRNWVNTSSLPSRSYVCGYCQNHLATMTGYHGVYSGLPEEFIYICHFCEKPTYFDSHGRQTPGASFGGAVSDIPDKTIEELYDESRRAMSTSSYTAAVLCCRKLLMHIAVSKGAQPGESFISYVQFLSDQHYVPVDAKDWVDHIRDRGNEANHEIVIMDQETAEDLIKFSEMLLKMIYEFPAAARRRKATSQAKSESK